MTLLLVVFALFIACGSAVTLLFSRLQRVELTVAKFVLAFSAAAALGVTTASLVIFALARANCPSDAPCEAYGLAEGGLFVGLVWLVCYSLAYLASAYFVARWQATTGERIDRDV